jgi:thiol-disulfide isomerase/thioredoxin
MKNFAVLLSVSLFFGCKSKSSDITTITLDVKNIPAQKIVLINVDGKNKPINIDSVDFKGDGIITFKPSLKETSFLQVVFQKDADNGKYIPIITNKEAIVIKGDYADLKKLTVTGSTATSDLWNLFKKAEEDNAQINRLGTSLDSVSMKKGKANDSLVKAYEAQIKATMENSYLYKTNFSRTTTNPVLALMGIQTLSSMEELIRVKPLMDSLKTKHTGSGFFTNSYEAYSSMVTPKQKAATANTATPAKEIALADVNGKIVSLSSFKGKYVLVDFWASWCGPCRGENPNVVAAYNTFKGKNFTILGVSLDEDKGKWVEAIAKDKLAWTHISDLKGWQSPVVQDYHIEGIPANFLVDPSGTIIASNLRGRDLQTKLAEVLK